MLTALHDKEHLHEFLARDPRRQVYSLGDLDDFFWGHTQWYGWLTAAGLQALVLMYLAPQIPTLLIMGRDAAPLSDLVDAITPLLPTRFYTHIEHGLESRFEALGWRITSHGAHLRMALEGPLRDTSAPDPHTQRLNPDDLASLEHLYAESYPGNWFDQRMLETGQYFGWRSDEKILAVAGIHVYSPRYGVAALGNITTHPAHRGKGLGRAVTTALCRSLTKDVSEIALNVHAENTRAIKLYEGLGFVRHCAFLECMVEQHRAG